MRWNHHAFIRLFEGRGTVPRVFARAVGVSDATVSNWKTNSRVPSPEKAWLIARYYGVPVLALYEEAVQDGP